MKFRGDYIQECVCTELIQNAGYNRGWHSMAMLTYLKKKQNPFFCGQWKYCQCCSFYYKDGSCRNLPFLSTCDQVNVQLFHFDSLVSEVEGLFLELEEKDVFSHPAQILRVFFLWLFSLPVSTVSPSLVLQNLLYHLLPLCTNSAHHFCLHSVPHGPSICVHTAISDFVYLKYDCAFSLSFTDRMCTYMHV